MGKRPDPGTTVTIRGFPEARWTVCPENTGKPGVVYLRPAFIAVRARIDDLQVVDTGTVFPPEEPDEPPGRPTYQRVDFPPLRGAPTAEQVLEAAAPLGAVTVFFEHDQWWAQDPHTDRTWSLVTEVVGGEVRLAWEEL